MRIVYCIAGTYNSGGMERVLANKANYLVSHGYEVFIITTDQRGKQPFFSLDERIRCYDLGINYEENNGKSLLNKIIHYPFKQWKHWKRLSELLRELRADIAISMFCNDVSFLWKIKDGSRKILEIHFSRYKRLQYGRKGAWKLADQWRSRMDEKTVKKRWKEDSAKCMTELAEVIAGIEDFSIEGQERVVMDWIAEKGYHTGNIMNAFRLTLVGEGKGPHMFDISWVLGKEETLARMKRAVEVLK